MPRTRFFRCSCTELWSSANRWTMCCLPYAKLKWKEHLYQSELALSKHDSTIHYTSIQYSNILFYAVYMQTAIMLTLCWGKVKHLYQLKLYRTTRHTDRPGTTHVNSAITTYTHQHYCQSIRSYWRELLSRKHTVRSANDPLPDNDQASERGNSV